MTPRHEQLRRMRIKMRALLKSGELQLRTNPNADLTKTAAKYAEVKTAMLKLRDEPIVT